MSQQAFIGLHFEHEPPPNTSWTVSYDDHLAYLFLADVIKRRQLAKSGARLAEIPNTIWPLDRPAQACTTSPRWKATLQPPFEGRIYDSHKVYYGIFLFIAGSGI